jgi:hypothetical protein
LKKESVVSKWFVKTKGQLERINHKLIIQDDPEGMTVTHQEYGFVAVLTPEDTDCINLVRDILFELSEKHTEKSAKTGG